MIHDELKAIYQAEVNKAIEEGKPYKAIKDEYQDVKKQFLRKAKGLSSSISPSESVSESVMALYVTL